MKTPPVKMMCPICNDLLQFVIVNYSKEQADAVVKAIWGDSKPDMPPHEGEPAILG